MSIYTESGYLNRRDYLNTLAADYGLSPFTVHNLAALLGAEEDFDGLVSTLENLESERS